MSSEDYFKDQYFYELNRRDRLTRDLTLPFGVLVALFGAFLWLLNRLSFPFNAYDGAVLVLLGFALCLKCLTSVIFWRVWAENPYNYPATLDQIQAYAETLKSHYAQLAQKQQKKKARKALQEFLTVEYIRCGTHNALMNDIRAARLNWVKRLTLIVSSLILIAFLINIFDSFASSEA